MNGGSDLYKPYHFLKELMRFRCICVNCFSRLRFLAEVSTKLQKMHFLDNLRTITQEGNIEARQLTPFFSCTFSALNVLEFKNISNSFSCGSPFGPFWSVKHLNVGQRLPMRTAHHTFLESYQKKVSRGY